MADATASDSLVIKERLSSGATITLEVAAPYGARDN